MGLFTSDKTTYVSSVAYNVAGPEEDRIDYLKTAVFGSILGSNNNFTMSKMLTSSYLNGPGLKLKAYHRWALRNYDIIGVPTDSILGAPTINPDTVLAAIQIEDPDGMFAYVEWVTTGPPDVTYFARSWLQNNEPTKATMAWTADYIDATGEILITFESEDPIVFTPSSYVRGKSYVYAGYIIKPLSPSPDNIQGTPKTFIYNLDGTYPEINEQFLLYQRGGRYLPFIPLRVENEFLSETNEPEAYAIAKKAYRKVIGGSYDKLISKIEDNPDLDEIDFAYVMFGVSLNVKDMAARRYIFEYFLDLKNDQLTSPLSYAEWTGDDGGSPYGSVQSYQTNKLVWDNWYSEMETIEDGDPVPSEPPAQSLPSIPQTRVRIDSQGTFKSNLSMEMIWQGMEIVDGTGLAKPDAKTGDVWFTVGGTDTFEVQDYAYLNNDTIGVDRLSITKQVNPTTWKRIDIIGFVHENHIYNGKSVRITAAEALADPDESGFIVPLRYSTLGRMNLIDLTQMSTACVNLVFNCYQIVKTRWYQKGWFKVFLVIAAIILTVVTGGLGASSAGLLGYNIVIGVALGFAGTVAIIVGAIANAIAAMIVSKLLLLGATAILGDELGTIVAIIATVMTLQIGASLQTGATLASSWTSMLTPQNLMNLSLAGGDGYAGMVSASTQEYIQKTQDILSDYAKQQKELEAKQAEVFGSNTVKFDPLALVGANPFYSETMDSFLSRTLMTGSDVAELSHRMIDGYVDATLSTELS